MQVQAVLFSLVWGLSAGAQPPTEAPAQDSGRAPPVESEAREIETYDMVVEQQIMHQHFRNAQERTRGEMLRQQAVASEQELASAARDQNERRSELQAVRRLLRIEQQEIRGRVVPAD
jgi:hypothetical protein